MNSRSANHFWGQNFTVLCDDGYFAGACGALSFSGENMIVGWGDSFKIIKKSFRIYKT